MLFSFVLVCMIHPFSAWNATRLFKNKLIAWNATRLFKNKLIAWNATRLFKNK